MSDYSTVFRFEREGQTLVIVVLADLREMEYPAIEAGASEVFKLLSAGTIKNVVMDFAKSDYYGSTALGLFVKLWKRVKAANGRMAFCNVSTHEREILRVTSLDELWPICGTRTEALKSVTASSQDGFAIRPKRPEWDELLAEGDSDGFKIRPTCRNSTPAQANRRLRRPPRARGEPGPGSRRPDARRSPRRASSTPRAATTTAHWAHCANPNRRSTLSCGIGAVHHEIASTDRFPGLTEPLPNVVDTREKKGDVISKNYCNRALLLFADMGRWTRKAEFWPIRLQPNPRPDSLPSANWRLQLAEVAQQGVGFSEEEKLQRVVYTFRLTRAK